MNIWRCNCYDKDLGQLVSWHATRKKATEYLLNFKEERGEEPVGPEGIVLVQLPTDKHGLIHWLNDNVGTDNG